MKSAILFFVLLSCTAAEAQATNVYLTPSGTATGNCPSGTASAPNLTAAQFSTAANWGTGTGKIGAGTTVLICGTFIDSTPGDTLLSVQANGSSGNPITLLFDTNASLTNTTYWGAAGANAAAVWMGSHTYITVDGGANGLIQNTGNGTGLAYEHNSSGIAESGGDHIIIKNLTIADICQHTSSSDTFGCQTSGSTDSAITLIQGTNITVQSNIIHDTATGVYMSAPSVAIGLSITGNKISRCNWGVGIGIAYAGTGSAVTIMNNDISDAYNWDESADNFHHNGIMVFDNLGLSNSFTGFVEADNYIHGDFGVDSTAWIFNDDNSNLMSGFYIYNNVLVNGNYAHPVNNCYITGYANSSYVLNNTILGPGIGICSELSAPFKSHSGTIENNLLSSQRSLISVVATATIDYNQYQDITSSGCHPYLWGGGPCAGQDTLAAWQSACSCDTHASYQAANTVNPNGTLQAGSPAIGAGVNLTSLAIAGLDTDASGVARPAVGAWDIGAYQYAAVPSFSGGYRAGSTLH